MKGHRFLQNVFLKGLLSHTFDDFLMTLIPQERAHQRFVELFVERILRDARRRQNDLQEVEEEEMRRFTFLASLQRSFFSDGAHGYGNALPFRLQVHLESELHPDSW